MDVAASLIVVIFEAEIVLGSVTVSLLLDSKYVVDTRFNNEGTVLVELSTDEDDCSEYDELE